MKTYNKTILISVCNSLILNLCLAAKYTPQEIINYAKTAAGSKYELGGSKWDPNDRKFGATDCAGLVLKAWRWPIPIKYKETLKDSYVINDKRVTGKLYTGSMLEIKKHSLPWSSSKNHANAQIADAFTFNNGFHGHTLLVAGFDSKDNIKSLEARSKKHGVGHFVRTRAHLKSVDYRLMKNKNIQRPVSIALEGSTQNSEDRRPTEYKAVFHKVTSGDTLSGLSRKYQVPLKHIQALNPNKIKNNNIIRLGDTLQIK